jgi:hypothetical protein
LALWNKRRCDIICFDEHLPRGKVEAENGLMFVNIFRSVF